MSAPAASAAASSAPTPETIFDVSAPGRRASIVPQAGVDPAYDVAADFKDVARPPVHDARGRFGSGLRHDDVAADGYGMRRGVDEADFGARRDVGGRGGALGTGGDFRGGDGHLPAVFRLRRLGLGFDLGERRRERQDAAGGAQHREQ